MGVIGIAVRNTDMVVIQNLYYALAIFAETQKHYDNSIFAYTKLRSAAE